MTISILPTRPVKPFVFQLRPFERDLLLEPGAELRGGHLKFQSYFEEKLADSHVLQMDDAEFGAIMRVTFQHGEGGFQGRLRKALIRPLRAMMEL